MTPITLRVRELREAKGLTQAELAERAHIRRATVNRIENGKVSGVDFSTLEALALALAVDPGFLIVWHRPSDPATQQGKRRASRPPTAPR
ncbi:MAG: helix-turn-helix transcriptional regulator [bacterium]